MSRLGDVGSFQKCDVVSNLSVFQFHEQTLEVWQSLDVIGFEMTSTDENLGRIQGLILVVAATEELFGGSNFQ